MYILLGLWPNIAGSGVTAIRKVIKAPVMIPSEGSMLLVPELDIEVLVASRLPGNDSDIDCELRCTTDPEHIERLRLRNDGWERVTETTCTFCPRQ